MKKIKIKNINKLIEAIPTFEDPKEAEFRTDRRIAKALKAAAMAREAAKAAAAKGDTTLAADLEAEAVQLERWATQSNDSSGNRAHGDSPADNSDQKNGGNTDSGNTGKQSEKNQSKTPTDKTKDSTDDNSQEQQSGDAADSKTDTNSSGSDDDSSSFSSAGAVQNPFQETPRSAKGNSNVGDAQAQNSKELSREETIAAMKEVLKMLNKHEAAGAKQAFNDFTSKNTQKAKANAPLKEAIVPTDSIGAVTDDEFNTIINSVFDKIDKVSPLDYVDSNEDRDIKISKMMSDPEILRGIRQEDIINASPEEARLDDIEQDWREGRMRQNIYTNDLPGTAQLKADIESTVAEQIADEEDEEDSWSARNKHNQGTSLLRPGQLLNVHGAVNKPIITLFMDCSGSFSNTDIAKSSLLVKQLEKWRAENKLELIKYYFANNVYRDDPAPARAEGGTDAWPKIIKTIEKDRPTNILIITDSDMNSDADVLSTSYIAAGKVWFLWKNSSAPKLTSRVQGLLGTSEFELDW